MSSEKKIIRDESIDLLKILAVFLVLNSHMGMCYEKFSFLATGGAIGDALFFFVSGFTLFLGGNYRFDNWYKRRIFRIYPTVLAVGIISCLFLGNEDSFLDVLTAKRYWFVRCIFLYYALLYPVKCCVKNAYVLFAVLSAVFFVGFFFLYDHESEGLFWGSNSYFRWFYFFLITLQGAVIGRNDRVVFKKIHLAWLAISVFGWYGLCYLFSASKLQILSAVPMFGITYFLYSFANSFFVKK